MKLIAISTAFFAAANASAAGNATCCFTLTASGGESGPVGQIDDGQTRIGNGTQPGQFCIDSSGGIVDGKDRGCFLTPPTSQLQCDEGAFPEPGFSVDSSGRLYHNGSTEFIACQSSQGDQLNIYTNPAPQDVNGCQNVSFAANNCHSTSPSASVPGGPAPTLTTEVPPPGPGRTSPSAPSGPGAPGRPEGPSPGSGPGPSGPEGGPGGGPHPGPPGGTSPSSPENSHPAAPSAPGGPGGTGTPAPGALGVPPPPSPPVASETEPSQSGTGHPESPGGPGTSPTGTGNSPSSPSETGCPTDLTPGNFEFPHLIIPIDSSSPSKALGTSFNGTIDSTVSSLFNFDIPPSLSGKLCSLVFLFPKKDKLVTSSFSFSGDGEIDFAQLQSPASLQTSANDAPVVKLNFGVTKVSPGHSYTIETFYCPAGETITFEMKNAGTTELEWFEDFNPAAIGLFITAC